MALFMIHPKHSINPVFSGYSPPGKMGSSCYASSAIIKCEECANYKFSTSLLGSQILLRKNYTLETEHWD